MSSWFNYVCYFLSAWAVFVVALTVFFTFIKLRDDKKDKSKKSNLEKEKEK